MILNESKIFEYPTEIKIRFNTTCKDGFHYWRVIVNGITHLASNITINCQSFTTKDIVPGVGEKWHITAIAKEIIWNGEDEIVIN